MEPTVNFKPLRDRVVIGVYAGKSKTESGFYIPENSTLDKNVPMEGVVSAIGPDVKDVEIGDDVLFSYFSGQVIKIGNQSFMSIPEKEILGITQSRIEKEEKNVDPKELRSIM